MKYAHKEHTHKQDYITPILSRQTKLTPLHIYQFALILTYLVLPDKGILSMPFLAMMNILRLHLQPTHNNSNIPSIHLPILSPNLCIKPRQEHHCCTRFTTMISPWYEFFLQNQVERSQGQRNEGSGLL